MRERSTLGPATERSAVQEHPSEAMDALCSRPHRIEECVQRELLAHPSLRFSSLVVRRVRNGVCLEGVLQADDDVPDVDSLARRVAGVETVLNHLVVQRPPERLLPAKG